MMTTMTTVIEVMQQKRAKILQRPQQRQPKPRKEVFADRKKVTTKKPNCLSPIIVLNLLIVSTFSISFGFAKINFFERNLHSFFLFCHFRYSHHIFAKEFVGTISTYCKFLLFNYDHSCEYHW